MARSSSQRRDYSWHHLRAVAADDIDVDVVVADIVADDIDVAAADYIAVAADIIVAADYIVVHVLVVVEPLRNRLIVFALARPDTRRCTVVDDDEELQQEPKRLVAQLVLKMIVLISTSWPRSSLVADHVADVVVVDGYVVVDG